MKNTLKRILLVIGGLFLIPWGAAQAQTTIRMEAEDMTLDTYKVESLSFASNGALINLKGPGVVGSATAAFPGETGAYDITVVYHDENDGVAQLSVSIAGNTVDSWSLDKSISGGQQPEEFNRFTREITTGYEISNGDEIRIDGLQGNWDHANVDYIEFVGGGGGSTGNPPIVLDFSKGDVIVDEPGYYVLDRDSVLPDYGLFEVSANDVTIDFRGYTLEGEGGFDNHLYITADRVTLKNGTVSGDFDVVGIGGDILVTDMRLDFSAYFQLGGCRVQNSVLISEIELNGCVLQANRIERPIELVDAASQVMDNQINAPIYSFGGADDSVIARNTMMGDDPNTGINITGNNFQVIDNLIQVNETGDRAIVIDGTGNMLRGNIVRSSSDPSVGKWNYGIVFLQDGNYYGDNLISAEVPFELGGTIQVDLGGNQGL